jgi:hypothetical protein
MQPIDQSIASSPDRKKLREEGKHEREGRVREMIPASPWPRARELARPARADATPGRRRGREEKGEVGKRRNQQGKQ